MKSFQQFITEVYDKDLTTATRKPGEGGRVRASRKKTEPEKRRVKAVGGGKTVPAKTYKDKTDIGKTNRKRSPAGRQQQPEKTRGSAALSPKEAQKKAYKERKAREKGAKTKTASELLSKKKKTTVSPNYKPQKASGYTAHERKKIMRAGRRLVRDIAQGKEKHISHYDPKL